MQIFLLSDKPLAGDLFLKHCSSKNALGILILHSNMLNCQPVYSDQGFGYPSDEAKKFRS